MMKSLIRSKKAISSTFTSLRSGAVFGYDAHACPLQLCVNGSVRKPQTRRQSPKMPCGARFHVSRRQRPKHEVELTYRFDAARLHDTAKHGHRITIQVPRMYNRAEIAFSHTVPACLYNCNFGGSQNATGLLVIHTNIRTGRTPTHTHCRYRCRSH